MTAAAMALLITILVWMVIARNVFSLGQPWLNDLARYTLIWLVFIAAVPTTVKGDQITMDAVYLLTSERTKRRIRYFTGIVTILASVAGFYMSALQAVNTIGQTSATGVFPAVIGYVAIPVGFFFMFLGGFYYTLYVAPEEESDEQVTSIG